MDDRRYWGRPPDRLLWLAPLARRGAWGLGLLLGAALFTFGWRALAPVPLLLLVLAVERWLQRQSVPSVSLSLHGAQLTVSRPEGLRTLALDQVRAVSGWRRARPDGTEVVLALTTADDRLVISVRAPGCDWPGAVPVDRWEAQLGPLGALRRGVGGRRDEVAQTFTEAALLEDLRQRLPSTSALALRLFRRGPPSLDPLGAAADEAEAVLWLEGDRWWTSDGQEGHLQPKFLGPVGRSVEVTGVGSTPLVHLWIDLGGLTLTVPWIGAGGGVRPRPDPGGPAIGAAEGALLLHSLGERGLGWPVHGFQEGYPLAPRSPEAK